MFWDRNSPPLEFLVEIVWCWVWNRDGKAHHEEVILSSPFRGTGKVLWQVNFLVVLWEFGLRNDKIFGEVEEVWVVA